MFSILFQFVCSRNKLTRHLSLLSRTADAISDGDHVEKILRGRQNWTLLPTEVQYLGHHEQTFWFLTRSDTNWTVQP